MNPDLVFWLITPPNNIKGFIEAVAGCWGGKVSVIACNTVREERKKTGYTDVCAGVAESYVLADLEQGKEFAKNYLKQHKDAIHIFGGLRKGPAPYLYYFRKKYGKNVKIAAITEKPAFHSGSPGKVMMKRLCGNVLYRLLYSRAEKAVDVLFPTGLRSREFVKSHGWKNKTIYPFLYCSNNRPREGTSPVEKTVRFLYVGRFDYEMRGLDILMKAFDQMPGDGWSLTLVGGYGKKKDEVIRWADQTKNVNFAGRWPADEVSSKMQNFDVYLCPAKEDSWNGQVNEAISAGLGVICTDQAGSDELVIESKSGLVIPSDNQEALKEAVLYALSHHDTVNKWKQNAANYAVNISTEVVAEYFCKILKYEFCSSQSVPQCPWLN